MKEKFPKQRLKTSLAKMVGFGFSVSAMKFFQFGSRDDGEVIDLFGKSKEREREAMSEKIIKNGKIMNILLNKCIE